MSIRHLGAALCLAGFALSPPMAGATGLLVPTDKSEGPLGIVYQRINVEIRDQAAVTRVEQEFRNHTSRQLEAYYLFPLPKDAGIKDFAMWVDGKRTKAELVEAPKAKQIYEDIVRRMKDPGLLEHMGNNLFRVRVFPIAPQSKQKIEISYSQVVGRDAGIAEYVYPLKTANDAVRTEDDFSVRLELNSSASIKSVYSPSHKISVDKQGDHKAIVGFEEKNYSLNRDFQMFWTVSDKEVGLSALAHRESPGDSGYFMLLLSPQTEMPKGKRVPRDVVFVVDTSGSMQGEKMEQAKRSLEFCLKSLDESDRFGLVSFATTVHEYEPKLEEVSKERIEKATRWVKDLTASGGTAIGDALQAALKLRKDDDRNFTVVFLTDGQPTIGETDPKNIIKSVEKQNTTNTRIFVFGVGDDVNTHLLDQLAEQTKGTSVYVRPKENLETKVSSFYAKISHPVLANLKLRLGDDDIKLTEMYPPKLPDLFHGSQLTVLGRFSGDGHTSVRLEGKLGDETKEFVYEVNMPAEKRENDFLPGLWARRKVGYLLDQIRLTGENKELVDEVTQLAKKYGIVTPYTSYLVVPDNVPPPTVGQPPRRQPIPPPFPPFPPPRPLQEAERLSDRYSLPAIQDPSDSRGGAAGESRPSGLQRNRAAQPGFDPAMSDSGLGVLGGGASARTAKPSRFRLADESGRAAVDTAEALVELKTAGNETAGAVRNVGKSSFISVGGVWVDQSYKKGVEVVTVKYLSDAYFKILEAAPQAKQILALGERVVWITPSGKALVIDGEGKESLTDEEISSLLKK